MNWNMRDGKGKQNPFNPDISLFPKTAQYGFALNFCQVSGRGMTTFFKKYLLLLLLLVFAAVSHADYVTEVTAGNTAFKSGDYDAAYSHYSKAYAEQPSAKLKKFLEAAKAKAFKHAAAMGTSEYRAGNPAAALEWFYRAKSYFPDKRLDKIITKIKSENPGIKEPGIQGRDNPLKWVLVGSDAALLIGAVAMGVAVKSGEDEYNEMYDRMNYSTQENYDMLMKKKKEVEGSQAVFGVLSVLAAAAIIYTAADIGYFHNLFPEDTSVTVRAKDSEYALLINRRF